MERIDIKSLTDEGFEALCHALLSKKHGDSYRAVDGRGGDRGIDGHLEDLSVVYQFKFYQARPRPAAFMKEINKVAALPGIKCWILIIPDDPTPRLNELVANEKAVRPFDVQVLGKTWILALLNEHHSIRAHFFPEVAKEESVRKVISLAEHRSKKSEQQHKEIRSGLRSLERKIESRRPKKISIERPSDCLTPEHRWEITNGIESLVKASKGRESFKKILAQLKNKYRVSNWHEIRDVHFGEIMAWLSRYFHVTRKQIEIPGDRRRQLQGVIKSQQKALGLTDKAYRQLLVRLTGKPSTTQMDLNELERVKDHLNLLMGQN